MKDKKIILPEKEIPRQWYNVQADLPHPVPPPLNPGTGQPITPDMLAPVFPMNLIEQEVSSERWIDIPDEVIEKYLIWRPTPLHRAYSLEKFLGTPARIYFKNEGVSPPGSHKPNTAIAQAYYNKTFGIKRLATETGAGQWGSALAFACSQFGLECKVYMVRVSYNQKPYRRIMMETWGAKCVPSPSPDTNAGKKFLAQDPEHPGSLGISISEAIEDAVTSKDSRYSLGSVLNHVLLHQTIIGLEAHKQFAMIGEYPDIVIGCAGGGSNFSGCALAFIRDKIHGKDTKIIACEPTSCPTMTKGPYIYDFGDTAETTPLLAMHSLGHGFIPPPIHAGGLRYHGMAPILSRLVVDGIVEARAYPQLETFKAGIIFARTEGFIPAPETNHAIAGVIEEAMKAKEEGKEKVILFNWSGHGIIDLAAYDAYLSGKLEDYVLPDEEIKKLIKELEKFPKPATN
ncbi:MAG TPA: TrpB-like pyridoxal phosphate-dependent enzyme [Thermodesulfovibrionales bacterium]|jgi:tryptophan synthase beta chain|nr:TrpB-like pyridoxal phosphate-dependent enzyme [Thermodesulfovibrionales bacterium]